jgi:hypothetical protein
LDRPKEDVEGARVPQHPRAFGDDADGQEPDIRKSTA